MTDRQDNSKRFTVRKSISQKPMSAEDWHASERILAKLIARAYARQNPHLFGPHLDRALNCRVSGSAPTARADAVAPAAQGADPEQNRRLEHDEGQTN